MKEGITLTDDGMTRRGFVRATARIFGAATATATAAGSGMFLSRPAAAAGSKGAMTPQVKLVDDYNNWFIGGAYAGDMVKLRAGLPKYITNETILHEVPSLPWGGTMVGYDGWVQLCQASAPILEHLGPLMEVSEPEYFQRGNVVIHEITMTIKPSPGAPKPFVMGIMEKYTIAHGRIKQIDEFYDDTASFLERLKIIGAIPKG